MVALTDLYSLVDEIAFKRASEATDLATQSAILGPFFRTDHPVRDSGTPISFNPPADAESVYMHGSILDATTKKPLSGASVDVWQASTNGMEYVCNFEYRNDNLIN